MAETKKKPSAKTAPVSAKQGAEQVTKKAEEIFENLKKHFEPKKVDAWQEKWLAVPANRKKYTKLQDAPEVVGEELVAMTNDIIDFIQGEEGGKSNVFKKLKAKTAGFFKNPIGFLQKKAVEGKEMTEKAAGDVVKQAKAGADKAKSTAGKTAKTATKTATKKAKK